MTLRIHFHAPSLLIGVDYEKGTSPNRFNGLNPGLHGHVSQ